MAASFEYAGSCVSLGGDSINEMKSGMRDVTLNYVRRRAKGFAKIVKSLGYDSVDRGGFTLKEDWYVSYFAGTFEGRPCVGFQWSGIEHVWIEPLKDSE